MDNLITSIKGVLYERISSPLFGSFVITWSLVNWRFISLIVLGNEKAVERISQIDSLNHTLGYKYLDYVAIPLLFSLLYIFVYPIISRPIYRVYKEYLESLQKIKNEVERKRLLTQEESDELRLEMSTLSSELAKKIESKDAEIRALNNRLNVKVEADEELDGAQIVHSNVKKISTNEEFLENLNQLKNSHYNILNEKHYNEIYEAYSKGMQKIYFDGLGVSRENKAKLENFKSLASHKGLTFISSWSAAKGMYVVESLSWVNSNN